MATFQVTSHMDKPHVELKIINLREAGSVEIECLCGNIIKGQYYKWRCNKCGNEYEKGTWGQVLCPKSKNGARHLTY